MGSWARAALLLVGVLVAVDGLELSKEDIEAHFAKLRTLRDVFSANPNIGKRQPPKIDLKELRALAQYPIPESTEQRTACIPGYTGQNCENPICDIQLPVGVHEGMSDPGDIIEQEYSPNCETSVSIFVDTEINDILVSITTTNQGIPYANLFDNNGSLVAPSQFLPVSPDESLTVYRSLRAAKGAGYYTLTLGHEGNEGGCMFQVTAPTSLVADGGFVPTVFDDSVQMLAIQPHEGVERYPVQGQPEYFAFRLNQEQFPIAPSIIHIYVNGDFGQSLYLTGRFHCGAPHITTANWTCTNLATYHLKILGVDRDGNQFQRVYNFQCDASGTQFTPPTGTGTFPIPTQTACYNNGTLYNGYCVCSEFFTGPQCDFKNCFNGGTFDYLNSKCLCASGYSGEYCQHVHCAQQSNEVFDPPGHYLIFVLREAQSMNAQIEQIALAAQNITDAYATGASTYFQGFLLSVVTNNSVSLVREYQRPADFIAAIRNLGKPPVDTECDDAIFTGISAALFSSSIRNYPRSPIYVFTDGVANDPEDVRYGLLQQLSYFRGPIYFMLTDSVTGRCSVDVNTLGYVQMRQVADFSGGLVVKTPLDQLAPAASAIAYSFYRGQVVIQNFLEDCRNTPTYQPFFVDETMNDVFISVYGVNVKALVTLPNRTNIVPDIYYSGGNLLIYYIAPKGNTGSYLLNIATSATNAQPCGYTVKSTTNYALTFGITNNLVSDEAEREPVWRQASHVVAHLNDLPISDPLAIRAETTLWTNDQEDHRIVLYASSGIYRDECSFHLYFGSFSCPVPNMLFHITVYITDRAGLTVQRTSTGYCSAVRVSPTQGVGCQNGGAMWNGTCVCPPFYTGDRCQTIYCVNGGTSLQGACACGPGYTGTYCETVACTDFNPYTNFEPNYRSLTLLIHDSLTTRSAIRSIRDVVARVAQDATHQHPQWLYHYQTISFNDTSFSVGADSYNQQDFIKSLTTIYNHNLNNLEVTCEDLDVLPTIYAALQDDAVSFNAIFYVVINGLLKDDPTTLAKIYNRIEVSRTQIHVIQTSGSPCGEPLFNPNAVTLMSLAHASNGHYYQVMPPNAGAVFSALPTFYRSSVVYENYLSACSNGTFLIPVDAYMQSFVTHINAELQTPQSVQYISPDGSNPNVVNIVNDLGIGARLDQVIQACDPGWDSYDNHCWRFSVGGTDWFTANATCHQNGAVLATIFNQADQDFLDYQTGGIDYWTGLNDLVNENVYVWDEIGGPVGVNVTGYTHWGPGQPGTPGPASRCVYDAHGSAAGWTVSSCYTVRSYACMKSAYNYDFSPSDPQQDPLPRGIWKVNVQANGGCSISVTAQSTIQVFTQYASNTHTDNGYPEPIGGSSTNHILAHVTGLSAGTTGSLEYAHMYNDNLTIIQAQNFADRASCTFEYMSTEFSCPNSSFQLMLSGVDNFGYLYQRIVPAVCLGGPTPDSCENNGLYYKGQCYCPPNYYGEFCEVINCQNGGYPTGALSACRCPQDFSGHFCELPVCTRYSAAPSIPNNENRTFVLVIDTDTGAMGSLLTGTGAKIQAILDASATQSPNWFTSYAAVLVRDSSQTPIVSSVITATNSTVFTSALDAAISGFTYAATGPKRALFNALNVVLSDPSIQSRSHVFVLTGSAVEDLEDVDLAQTAIARTHASVNLLFVDDSKPPGGLNYTDPSNQVLFEVSHISGGGYYQNNGPDALLTNWKNLLTTLFNSYYIVSNYIRDCDNLFEFAQQGQNETHLVVDLIAGTQNVYVSDGSGANANVAVLFQTQTNYLGLTLPGPSGIWGISVDQNATNAGSCYINVRGISPVDIYIAFSQDTASDGGLHSNDATLFPRGGFRDNAIVATTNGGTLTYAQIFDVGERRLRWASPLILRANCAYAYISANTFICDTASLVVAVDGVDYQGYAFRRMITVHCEGYIPTRPPFTGTFTFPTGTFPTQPAPTTRPPWPSCDPSVRKADVMFIFDVSSTLPREDFESILFLVNTIPYQAPIGPDQNRYLFATYADTVKFEDYSFNTINDTNAFQQQVQYLQNVAYTGEPGNNIYSVLNTIVYPNGTVEEPFRPDAAKIIVIYSSVGWDKGGMDGLPYPDPGPMATILKSAKIDIVTIGTNQANMGQLTAISSNCAKYAQGPDDLIYYSSMILSIMCDPNPSCESIPTASPA